MKYIPKGTPCVVILCEKFSNSTKFTVVDDVKETTKDLAETDVFRATASGNIQLRLRELTPPIDVEDYFVYGYMKNSPDSVINWALLIKK